MLPTSSIEETAFEALERDVADVLSRLEADASMERFRSEYNRLFVFLKRENESRKELHGHLVETKKSLSNAEEMLRKATRKEEDTTQEIATLRDQISLLEQRLPDRARQMEELEVVNSSSLSDLDDAKEQILACNTEEGASKVEGAISDISGEPAAKDDAFANANANDTCIGTAALPTEFQEIEISETQYLKNDIALERSKLSQLQLKNKTLELEHERIKAELDAAKAELELRDKAIQGLTTKVIGIEKIAREDKRRHEALCIDNRNQKKDIDALRGQMRTLEEEKRELKKELELVRSRLAKMEEEAATAAAEAAKASRAKGKSSAEATNQIMSHTSIRFPNDKKGEPMAVQELSRELLRAQHRLSKAECLANQLTLEMESPSRQNIHRWRKLESTDPDAMELLRKVASLQKHLIKKTDEASKKSDTISEQAKVIAELRLEISRHCNRAENFDELSAYQSSIALKDQQLRSMAGELNMHQVIVEDMKDEISTLNRELLNMKRLYFREKERALLSECGALDDTENVAHAGSSDNRIIDNAGVASVYSLSWAASAPPIRYERGTVMAKLAGGSNICSKIDGTIHFMGGGFGVK